MLAQRRANAEGEAVIEDARGFGETLVSPFSEGVLAISLLVLEALLFGVWFVRRQSARTPRHRMQLGAALVALSVFGLLIASGLLVKRGTFRDGTPAVVLEDRVPIREGPDPRASERALAREGEPATLLDVDQRFVLVRLPDGREGWVEAEMVGRI